MQDRSGVHWYGRNTWHGANNPNAQGFRRWIAAFDAAVAAGQGVAVLDGRIVENLHIVTARATLAKAAAIAALQTGEF